MKIQTLEIGNIGTNCYVISDDNGTCAIIDCDGNPQPLFRYIEENNLKPTHILLTHGHDDHIGAVASCAYRLSSNPVMERSSGKRIPLALRYFIRVTA